MLLLLVCICSYGSWFIVGSVWLVSFHFAH